MEAELIEDVDSYDPQAQNNEQLAVDWRIACAWYATLKDPEKEIKFSEEEIIKLGTTIVREIRQRVREGSMKHKFDIESMTLLSRDLFKEITGKLGTAELGTTLPVFPGRISERHPDLILLEDFLCRFRDHYLRKPFIQLVGSLANWGSTDGDTDILIKGDADEKIVQIESWRIERAFPDLRDRLEILDDSHWHGPFTNFIDVADLKVEVRSHLFVQEMKREPGFKADCEESKKEDRLELLRGFYQCKPTHGRNVGEIYSPDSVAETVNKLWPEWKEAGIFVGRKYDGTTNQLHKKGDEAKIFSEDGSDITENLPTIVEQAKKLPGDLIVIGELEVWKDGKHQPRAVSAGVVGHEGDPDEKHVRLTLYDLLYLDKDIHKESYAERRKKLLEFGDSENIKISRDEPLVKTEKELGKVIDLQRRRAGSEGAMLKLADKEYELDESTKWMIKFKNEYALNAKVIKRYQVKDSGDTYYYACALKDSPYAGKTFNTSLKLEEGDIIRVIFADISEYHDPELNVKWFNWWAPHVSESARVSGKGSQADTAGKAHELVLKTTGRIEEKKLPKFVRQIQNLGTKKKFVLQHHWRGDSVHVDFRYQTDHVLDGFTLNDAVEGVAGKYLKWKPDRKGDTIRLYWADELFYEIEKKTEKILHGPARALKDKVYKTIQDLEKKSDLWKVDWSTGEEKKRESSVSRAELEHQLLADTDSPLNMEDLAALAEKIWCARKAKEPYDWLFAEGVTPPRAIEEAPGGTEFYPGVFITIDRGTYDSGAQKPYFKEFFLRGNKVKGRVVFRQVTGLKETRGEFTWLYWKPDDQKPYVLSGRAIKKEWLPEEGSALPAEIEYKIPPGLVYWKKGLSREERLERRKKCAEFLKETRELGTTKFILSRRWWKGQEVVRKLQQQDFHLKIGERKFHLSENPEFSSSMSAAEFKEDPGFFRKGAYPPASGINPNKRIPAFIEIVDLDRVDIVDEENQSIKVIFHGRILKGDWILFRSSLDEIWTFRKQTIPKAKKGRPPLSEKRKYLIREVYRATGSVHETKRQTGHGFDTIYAALEAG